MNDNDFRAASIRIASGLSSIFHVLITIHVSICCHGIVLRKSTISLTSNFGQATAVFLGLQAQREDLIITLQIFAGTN